MILGTTFFNSTILNIAVVIVEILAFTGFYAAPTIIMRFGIKLSPYDEKTAKKFSIIFLAAYLVVSLIVILYFKLSILPLFFIVLWTPFSYGILTYDENNKSNIIVNLFAKYNELAVYIIVGVITTVVAWGVFYLLSFVLDSNNPVQLTINTILNWCAGVLVAYPMNRHWVFHSKSTNVTKELLGFVGSRISTLVIEELVMILCVNVLKIDQYISKYVIASILVIVLNYVFAKLFVFKKKEEQSNV